jgi:hypothetical protein
LAWRSNDSVNMGARIVDARSCARGAGDRHARP